MLPWIPTFSSVDLGRQAQSCDKQQQQRHLPEEFKKRLRDSKGETFTLLYDSQNVQSCITWWLKSSLTSSFNGFLTCIGAGADTGFSEGGGGGDGQGRPLRVGGGGGGDRPCRRKITI